MKKTLFKMFSGQILEFVDDKIDYFRDFGKTWVDGKAGEDGLTSAIEEDLSPRELEVCQILLDALSERLKKEYRELLVKGGYLKAAPDDYSNITL
jgi:hypothetical protein